MVSLQHKVPILSFWRWSTREMDDRSTTKAQSKPARWFEGNIRSKPVGMPIKTNPVSAVSVAERAQTNGETTDTSYKENPAMNVSLIKHFPRVIQSCWRSSNLGETFHEGEELENIQYRSVFLTHFFHTCTALLFLCRLCPLPLFSSPGFCHKTTGESAMLT